MIDIKLVIYVSVALLSIIGAIVTFFQMQTRQNMKIEQLQKDLELNRDEMQEAINELRRKQSLGTTNQIKSEKDIISINEKLDHILEAIQDLKRNGHP